MRQRQYSAAILFGVSIISSSSYLVGLLPQTQTPKQRKQM
jgi:hypothetical protein